MFDPPKTREDAQNHRYGRWAGKELGWPYKSAQCAYEVPGGPGGWIYHQCSRRPWCGPDALYCKQHAKRVGDEAAE